MTYEMFVAILALSVSVWQGIVTRKHNRLSIRPILRIDRVFVSGEPQGIQLVNTGAGPAVIKSITILVNDKIIDHKLADRFGEAVRQVGSDPTKVNMFVLHPEETFAAGERHHLMLFIKSTNDELELTERRLRFSQISFEIKYQSIYKEDYKLTG